MPFGWLRDVMRAVAERGQGTLYVDLSDRKGLDELLRVAKVRNGPKPPFVCDTTPAANDALLETNMSEFVQTVGDDVFLYGSTAWDEGLYLCVEDEDPLRRFSRPAPRPPE